MIEFTYIRWKNFVSYGDVWTELPLNGKKATLAVGDNGAGKSTMIDALCYSLYGKAFRDVATTQLVNSINTNHMEVECEFKIGRSNYKVCRGLKPRLFEVYKDEELLNQDANARDYQEILERQILKVNHKSFKQIVVLGSSSFVPFMQLRSQDRKEVIEDLLDIGIFSVMSLLLKDKASYNKTMILKLEQDKSVIDQRIALVLKHIEELESQKEEDIKNKENLIESIDIELETINSEIKRIHHNISVFEQGKEDELKVKKERTTGEKILDQLVNKQKHIETRIEFFHNKDECPTCQQNIDPGFKSQKITEEQKDHDEVEDGIVGLQSILEEKNKRLEEINSIQVKINNLQHEMIDQQSLLNSKSMYRGELEKQVIEVRDNKTLIKQSKSTIEEDQIFSDNIYEEKTKEIRNKSVIELATKLLKDTGIKSKIIKQYIPVINKLINKYLAAMDFFVQFELDENFNEVIKSRHRDEFSYASFSEGEKMRIDLSLLFAWRAIAKLKNSASTNLLIMDEVFDSSLDTSGTEEFMKIIMEIVSDTNIFIISHKTDLLIDKFTNVIRFEKHKNFSRMVA